MKIKVEVSFLPGVEGPEAVTLTRNLRVPGYELVRSVKISRMYEFDLANDVGKNSFRKLPGN